MNKYEIIGKKATLFAWYHGGKIKKIEVKKGSLTQQAWENVPHSITNDEDVLQQKMKEESALTYKLISEDNTAEYKDYVGSWFDFYYQQNAVEPKFDGSDGKALKQIKTYFEKVSTDGTEALATWRALLQNWHHLDEFYRKNLDLKFINSSLNKIIMQLKDVTSKAGKGNNADGLRQRL
jgi:hypothetical protein